MTNSWIRPVASCSVREARLAHHALEHQAAGDRDRDLPAARAPRCRGGRAGARSSAARCFGLKSFGKATPRGADRGELLAALGDEGVVVGRSRRSCRHGAGHSMDAACRLAAIVKALTCSRRHDACRASASRLLALRERRRRFGVDLVGRAGTRAPGCAAGAASSRASLASQAVRSDSSILSSSAGSMWRSRAHMMRGWPLGTTTSPISSSSYSFSPGRRPTNSISMSPSGCFGRALGQARQVDHRARQVGDAHRLAHVEHEHVAAARHRARLDDELRRLGDQHEVANDVRVGDRDGPAGLDLAPEQRHHRSRRAEHVAEADHREDRARAAAQRRRLEDQLGDALGGAHHVGRAHRLVGRDQDAGLDLRARARRARRPACRRRCCAGPAGCSLRRSARACRRRRDRSSGRRACAAASRISALVEHRAEAGDDLDRRASLRAARARSCRARIRSDRAAAAWPGRCDTIWRHSSLPIEPPAPVTSTTLPAMLRANSGGIGRHRVAAEQVGDVDLADVGRSRPCRRRARTAPAGSSPAGRRASTRSISRASAPSSPTGSPGRSGRRSWRKMASLERRTAR